MELRPSLTWLLVNARMDPEDLHEVISAYKKVKCTLAVSTADGELRILGASDEPLVILKGQVCELREVGGQVHVIQRVAMLLRERAC
jgi:hypothetical protein